MAPAFPLLHHTEVSQDLHLYQYLHPDRLQRPDDTQPVHNGLQDPASNDSVPQKNTEHHQRSYT